MNSSLLCSLATGPTTVPIGCPCSWCLSLLWRSRRPRSRWAGRCARGATASGDARPVDSFPSSMRTRMAGGSAVGAGCGRRARSNTCSGWAGAAVSSAGSASPPPFMRRADRMALPAGVATPDGDGTGTAGPSPKAQSPPCPSTPSLAHRRGRRRVEVGGRRDDQRVVASGPLTQGHTSAKRYQAP